MKMEIEIPNGYKAKWVNGVLALVSDEKEDLRPVSERVKTFIDACNELGEDHPLCIQSREIYDNFLFEGGDAVVDIVAYLKLRIITAALNEGWIPEQFNKELRYYPRFELYNENGWETLTEDIKCERGLLLSGDEIHGVVVNSVCDYMRFCPPCSFAYASAHLCFKSGELAVYAGKQFASLWLDLFYHPNTKCKPYFNE